MYCDKYSANINVELIQFWADCRIIFDNISYKNLNNSDCKTVYNVEYSRFEDIVFKQLNDDDGDPIDTIVNKWEFDIEFDLFLC